MTEAKPYIRCAGESRKQLVAGQAVHMLAGGDDTANAYGAVVCESAQDKFPIPRHFHKHEHDTWLCLRGRLRLWANDTSRILTEGDFGYVPPGDAHSYQCISPRTMFFGIVSPGGWEAFFEMAGEPWGEDGLPEPGHPFDFSKMKPAMDKYDIYPVEQKFVDAENGDATDRALPAEKTSYFLQAGYGERYRLGRHLITHMLRRDLSDNAIDMYTIESGRNAEIPELVHDETHVSFFVMNGRLEVSLNGEVSMIAAGDFVNIPVDTRYSLTTLSASSRIIAVGGNGNGLELLHKLATKTDCAHFETTAEAATFTPIADVDARLV